MKPRWWRAGSNGYVHRIVKVSLRPVRKGPSTACSRCGRVRPLAAWLSRWSGTARLCAECMAGG